MLERIVELFDQISIKLRLLIAIIVSTLAGYVGYMDNVEPANTTLAQAKTETASIDQEIAKINENFKQVVSLEEELKKAEEELVSLFTLLPPDVETDRLLGAMAQTASETGVLIRSFTPGVPTLLASSAPPPPDTSSPSAPPLTSSQPSRVRSHPIRIKYEGTYAQSLSFMDKLMEMPRIIKIENISMNPLPAKANGPDPGTLGEEPQTLLSVEMLVVAFSQDASVGLSALNTPSKTQGQQGSQPPSDRK